MTAWAPRTHVLLGVVFAAIVVLFVVRPPPPPPPHPAVASWVTRTVQALTVPSWAVAAATAAAGLLLLVWAVRRARRAYRGAYQRGWDAATAAERDRLLREVRMLEHAHLKSAVTEAQVLLGSVDAAQDDAQRALALDELRYSLTRLNRTTQALHGQVASPETAAEQSALPPDYQQTLVEVTRNFSRLGMACQLMVVGAPRPIAAVIGAAIQLVLYNALTNAQQHGRATRAQVELQFDLTSVTLLVHDNGIGFDLAAVQQQARGRGLHDMTYVAEQHGGRCFITSTRGAGTHIQVRFPLPRPTLGWGGATPEVVGTEPPPAVWSTDALTRALGGAPESVPHPPWKTRSDA